jgi:hypothetical protein
MTGMPLQPAEATRLPGPGHAVRHIALTRSDSDMDISDSFGAAA